MPTRANGQPAFGCYLPDPQAAIARAYGLIVLGDARTNGRPPRDDIFAAITAKAGRTFWLNPEPRLYWNYGDSVIAAYERHCTAFECWRTDQLEEFVKVLSRGERATGAA